MLFSQRNNPQELEILSYDSLPNRFRVQAYHLIKEIYNVDDPVDYGHLDHLFKYVYNEICSEHAILSFNDTPGGHYNDSDPVNSCLNFILRCEVDDWVVDILELLIGIRVNFNIQNFSFGLTIEDTQEKINRRFKENGLGLEFIEGQIIRVDSHLLYTEAIRPAIELMRNSQFSGPLDEYLEAHNQFKQGDNKAAITSAAKSFESTMKSICHSMDWNIGRGTAASLIQALFSNGFFPDYYQTQLNSLRTTLEVLSTVRNNNTGHGQGVGVIDVPDHLTQYALNLAGTNITFLIKTYEQYVNEN